MKKLLFIFPICLLISLSGCSPKLTPTPRVIEEMYFDYAPFTRIGFLISPDPYPSEFDACGEILIKVQPAKIIKIATQVLKDGDLVEVDADNGVVRILERAEK